jgi:hypothetical protein
MFKSLVACALTVTLIVGRPILAQNQTEAVEDKSSDPGTPEEVVPGVPLDGSIIIDESVWVTLLGEPGRHMTEAYTSFVQGELADSAESIHKAASFLSIATNNALKGPDAALQEAAIALDDLGQRVAKGEVKDAVELKSVFSSAHLAMSRNHAAKAADALTKKRWSLAGNYLSSSATHLTRASYWAGSELRGDTKQTIVDAQQAARRLAEQGGKSIERVGQLIETLGNRIERFGRRLWQEHE